MASSQPLAAGGSKSGGGRGLRSTAPKSELVITCPVSELPVVKGELTVQRIENRVGYYHYLGTQPILSREKFFKKHADKMFAIVAMTYSKTSELPARVDIINDNLMGYTCPVMSTWLGANGKTVLLPPDIPNLEEMDASIIWKWIFPKFGWQEYYILPASKKPESPKMFYRNPCDIVSFRKSCSGITSLKKYSESESERERSRQKPGSKKLEEMMSSSSMKVLMPATVEA
jgi:hypothetical protein